jgi:hypothetical protein
MRARKHDIPTQPNPFLPPACREREAEAVIGCGGHEEPGLSPLCGASCGVMWLMKLDKAIRTRLALLRLECGALSLKHEPKPHPVAFFSAIFFLSFNNFNFPNLQKRPYQSFVSHPIAISFPFFQSRMMSSFFSNPPQALGRAV